MPGRPAYRELVPFAPILLGLVASIWRFDVGDEIGGVLCALGGVAFMVVVGSVMFRAIDRP